MGGFPPAAFCPRVIQRPPRPAALAGARQFTSFEEALAAVKPDVVSVNTLPDTHAAFAITAMEAGAHGFVEKPLAETVADAEQVTAAAARPHANLPVGSIPPRPPSW